MTDLVKSLKIGNNSYSIQDANTLSALTAAQRTTLLSDGTYLGNLVDNGKIFETDSGKFEQFIDNQTSTWGATGVTLPSSQRWRYVRESNGKIFILPLKPNSSSTTMYSTYTENGVNWSLLNTPRAEIQFVAYGNGRYVFVASESSGYKTFYSEDLVTFYNGDNTLPYATWAGLVFSDGKFVLFRDGGNVYYTSTDGVSWSSATYTSDSNPSIQGFKYYNGRYMAVSSRGNAIYYSSDLSTWSKKSSAFPSSKYNSDFAYGNGVYVLVGATAGNNVLSTTAYYSTDGLNWSSTNLPFEAPWNSVAYGDGKFVAICGWTDRSQNRAAYSTDGINWTTVDMSASDVWYGCGYINEHFVSIRYSNYDYNSANSLNPVTLHDRSLTPLSYTKSEVDTSLASKQGTLTAGTNITIDYNNVISATGGGEASLADIATAGTGITFSSSEQQNFTIQGSPTITDRIVSNFNVSNFLSPTIPTPIFTTALSWELGFKVTTGSSLTDRNNIFQFCVDLTESTRYALAVYVALQEEVPYFGINSTYNGTAFDVEGLGQHVVLPNSQYYVRVGWTGTEYYLDYSTDGESFTRDLSIQSTTSTYSGLQYATIGVQYQPWAYTTAKWPWTGSIDLNECYIKADGTVVWTPYTDNLPTINNTGLINTATGTNSLTIGSTYPATVTAATNIGIASQPSNYGIALGGSSKAPPYGIAIGTIAQAGSSTIGSVLVGYYAKAASNCQQSVAIGYYAEQNSGSYGIAIGSRASSNANSAYMIGCARNSDANTLKVTFNRDPDNQPTDESGGLYTLLDSSGKIPAARLSNIYEIVQTMPASPTAGKIYFVTGSTT